MHKDFLHQLATNEVEKYVTEVLRLTRDGDILALADSPVAATSLLESWFVQAEPHGSAERGRAVQSMLIWLIERLKPQGTHSWTQLSWRSYNVLHAFYVEGRRIAEIAELLAVAEQTVYPIRAQAISTLTVLLLEELEQPYEHRPNYAIQELYPTLPVEQQMILRMCSIAPGAFDQALVYRLAAAVDLPQLEYHLQALVGRHMLHTNSQRTTFELVAKLRPFLRTLLPPDERRLWHSLAADYALEQAFWLQAMIHFEQAGAYHRAAQLVINHHQEIIDAFQGAELRRVLARLRAADLDDPELWVCLKLVSGDVALTMDDVPSALREYQQALSATDLVVKAEAYYKRGRAFRSQNTAEAEAHLQYCIRLLEQTAPTEPLLYRAYLDLAWMLFQDRQDWEAAETALARAEALIDPANRAGWAEFANAWGMYHSHRGNHEQAKQFHRDAWLAANEIQDALLLTHMAHNLGNDYMALHEYDQALVYFRQSAELAQESHNRRMEGLCEKSIGACCFWLGLYERAIEHYEHAYMIFHAMQNRNWLANTCYDLAEAHAELGDNASMQRFYDEAVNLARSSGLERLLNDLVALAHTYPGLYPPDINLNERQQQLFDYLREHPTITNRDYRTLTRISPKQAARDLNDLVERQILERTGDGRSTAYRLAANDS